MGVVGCRGGVVVGCGLLGDRGLGSGCRGGWWEMGDGASGAWVVLRGLGLGRAALLFFVSLFRVSVALLFFLLFVWCC